MAQLRPIRQAWLWAVVSFTAAATAPSPNCCSQGITVRLGSLPTADHRPVITAMAIDPQGEILAVAGDDRSIRLLDPDDLSEIGRLIGHRDLVRTLAFRPDGQILASAGNDGRLNLWSRAAGWEVARRAEDLPTLFSVRFSPDGRQLAAVGFDSQLLLFGPDSPPSLPCQCSDLRSLAYHHSGKWLAVVGRSGALHLFDPQNGSDLGKFPIHSSRIRDMTALPGTDLLATVSEDGAVTLFDLKSHRITAQIDLLPCKLFTVAAIDGSTIAVAGSSNRIRIVDCQRGEVIAFLDGHQGSINSLIHCQGTLYSGGFDTTVRKWQVGGPGQPRMAKSEPNSDRERLAERERAADRERVAERERVEAGSR